MNKRNDSTRMHTHQLVARIFKKPEMNAISKFAHTDDTPNKQVIPNKSEEVIVSNVSSNGIGLVTKTQYLESDLLSITLLLDGEALFETEGLVRYSLHSDKAIHRTGVLFLDIHDDAVAQIDKLLKDNAIFFDKS